MSSHGDPISTAVAPRSPNHRATLAEPHKAPLSLPGTVQMYLYWYKYLSSPRAKRAGSKRTGPKGLRAESARAFTGRRTGAVVLLGHFFDDPDGSPEFR